MKKIYLTDTQIKTLIEENLHKDIDSVINSNLSISKEVEDASDEISELISNELCKLQYSKFNDIEKSIFSIEYKFINVKVSFVITNYNFKDKNQYNKLRYKYNDELNNSKMSFLQENNYCIIWLSSCSINNKINKVVTNDNIQHEISHLYQDIKSNNILPNDDYYSVEFFNLKNNNDLIRDISTLIYLSYNFEQDGYVNGLNQFIKNNEKPFLEWDDIKESSAYTLLRLFRETILKLKEYNISDIESVTKKYFNLKYIEFNNLIVNKEKRFLNKIGRVLFKHRKKCILNGLRINENINNYYLIYY